MPIKSLSISWLGPFKHITLDFDSRVNVLIGPNNCGKTTILMALAEMCIHPFSVPERFFRSGKRPKVGISLRDEDIHVEHLLPWVTRSADAKFLKHLGYTDFVPALRENTAFRPKSPLGKGTGERERVEKTRRGVAIHGYRVRPAESYDPDFYQEGEYSKTDMEFIEKQESDVTEEDEKELRRRKTWVSRPSRITDEEIVSKIVELDYRAYRKNDYRYRKVISLAAGIASEIMIGFPVTFDAIEENGRGLFPQFKTPDGKLPMDKLSQGTQSILQWVYHLVLGMAEYYGFPSDLRGKKGVFIID